MKKQISTFGILGILIISGLISASAVEPNIKIADIEDQGIFEADLGRQGSNEPFITLRGDYRIRDRFVVFGGTATSGNKEERFREVFGGTHFVIKIPIIGRTITIFGRLNIMNDNTFQGVWIGRGTHVRG